jgi:hypothetical protein
MNFTRETLPEDLLDSDATALCARLTPGCWMIEVGLQPPSTHDPERLRLGDGLIGGLALSLSGATLINLSLGPALVDRLTMLGPSLGPLAGLALHELIVNAVIHGNLHVESGGSCEWGDLTKRQVALAKALADPSRARRVVTIAAGWRAGEVVVAIADEGEGYDVTAPQTVTRGSGRGLRLARMVGRLDVGSAGRQTAITMGCVVYSKEGRA